MKPESASVGLGLSLGVGLTLDKVAVRVHQSDTVAVAKKQIAAGTRLLYEGAVLEVDRGIDPGHRLALKELAPGEVVTQYGSPIGRASGLIAAGAEVDEDNLETEQELTGFHPSLWVGPVEPRVVPPPVPETFMGYRRADGRVGTRNYILVVPCSMCAATEASRIAEEAARLLPPTESFDGVVALPHDKGCGLPDGEPLDLVLHVLAQYITHPNVGGVVLVELGCEKAHVERVRAALAQRGEALAQRGEALAQHGQAAGKPVKSVCIQEAGGTKRAIAAGVALVADMYEAVAGNCREAVPVSELSLGVKCGGSDGMSGISANPALGYAADILIAQGGTVILTEVTEIVGAEHVLARTAYSLEAAKSVYDAVEWFQAYAGVFGHSSHDNPSPGNHKGGLTNIVVKSLGAVAKAGTSPLMGTVDYCATPPGKGLYLMQGPGYDQTSTPALVAGGCQVVGFTTGRGTTIGNAIAPVFKVSSNTAIYERMRDDIDVNAGTIMDGDETVEQAGRRIWEAILRWASGEPVNAELTGHREFQMWGGRTACL